MNQICSPAMQKAYSWIALNKFMFAHMIKRYHVAAYEVERIDYDWQPRSVVCLFQRITAECDFFQCFP